MVTAEVEPVSLESRIAWFAEHNPSQMPLWVATDANDSVFAWVSFQPFYGRAAYSATAEISIYVKEQYRDRNFGGSY